MHARHDTNGTSQAAIFTRLWETKDGKLPRALARVVLKVGFPPEDRARMHELAAKNQKGTISVAESEELDSYITTGDLLALLQSKARKTLRTKKVGATNHG